MMGQRGLCSAILVLLFAPHTSVHADPPVAFPASVQSAVVIVTVTGVDTANGNAPVSAQGTGFFISKNGYLVTSYHLVTDLRRLDNSAVHDIDRSTVTYQIQTQRFGALPIPASYMDANPAADILILYAPLAQQNIQPLPAGDRDSEQIVPGSTPIFDPGFPAGLDYNVSQGFITSWNGPLNPLTPAWTTSLSYKYGQSGSPIVVADGRVVAIVKGVDEDATQIGFVVPVQLVPQQYWDGSLRLGRDAATLANGGGNDVPRVVVKAVASVPVPTPRTKDIDLSNAPCAPPKHIEIPVFAANGWTIDPASIHMDPVSSRGTVSSQIESRSTGGFQIGVDMQNDGQCSTWLPAWTGGSTDVPASFKAVAEWVETEINPPPTSLTVASTAAIGNSKVTLPLDSAAKLSFSVERSDGKTVAFAPQRGEIGDANGRQVLDASKIVSRLGLGG